MVTKRPIQWHQHGITLIELMIVVAIVALLAMVAYPSYRDQVRRSNRAEGKSALLNAAALQERYFSNNNSYGTLAQIGVSATTEKGYYILSAASTTTTYTLTATKSGGQADDTKCVTMTLTNTGTKGGTGSQCDCATAASCW